MRTFDQELEEILIEVADSYGIEAEGDTSYEEGIKKIKQLIVKSLPKEAAEDYPAGWGYNKAIKEIKKRLGLEYEEK